ncbi:sugar phosphate isomerase/epimerase [Rhizobium sp. BK456]|nr:sugar phosphate isomerase/epimerase [Rhizobium sp. BK456]
MGRIGAGFYADRHWNLGEGSIHWHAVFAALARLEGNPP